MHTVRIFIAEGHEAMRRALRAAIRERVTWTVCGEATTAAAVLTETIERMPDVVLLDTALPGANSFKLTRTLCRAAPATKILVLSVYESASLADAYRQSGAHGYVLKADAGRLLVEAIDAVLGGRTSFSGRMQRVSADFAEDRPAPSSPARSALTPRERQVLQLLAEGKTNKEVADALGISVKTVETHRARIMGKLDLHSMNELVRYAIRNRLINA